LICVEPARRGQIPSRIAGRVAIVSGGPRPPFFFSNRISAIASAAPVSITA